jgi:hypothetical protein
MAAKISRLNRAKEILEEEHKTQCADHEKRMAERAAKEAATGRKTPGRKPAKPEPDPERKANVTDPDSRIMKNPRGGHTQGYNAQGAAAGDHLKLAAHVTQEQNDLHQLHPLIEETAANLAAAGSKKKIGAYLGDSGYCTDQALAAIDPAGHAVLLSTGKERETRRRAAGEPANEGPPPEGLTLRGKWNGRWAPPRAKPSTRGGPPSRNPSSPRSNTTAASSGSCAQACPPPTPSGNS